MKTNILKTVLLFITFTFINCSNNEDPQDQLPPITQTGANTFGCLVNGRVFVPKDAGPSTTPGGGRPRGLEISSGDGLQSFNYYAINARNYIDTDIYIEDRPQQKKYTFKDSPGVSSSIQSPSYPHMFCVVNGVKYLSYENSGYINFTIVDFAQEVCAGIFTVKLKNENNENDIIEITEGRFDLICTEPIGD
ncbi:hypothetical protein Q4553_00860 [Tenacibaculum soleae]|uniref:hypothetical protein n=1 Tax=Tenacibaculum soleae TaxID=447689 RepID=UPI0026E2212A|nr:hypothetical protein [Tenacibaculum soleae]MDO6743113.1 hypothetical protein [Tenacibaculum soleae]